MYNPDLEGYKAKRIHVFENGNCGSRGRLIVVHPTKDTIWNIFLSRLTTTLKPHFGNVRHLVTVDGKSSIHSFTDLVHEAHYVACGYEKYKQVCSGYINSNECRNILKGKPKSSRNDEEDQNTVTSYDSELIQKHHRTVVYLFVNGRQRQSPIKYEFIDKGLRNWPSALSDAANSLGLPDVQSLYTLSGHRLCGPEELHHGACYVAKPFGDTFKNFDYFRNLQVRPLQETNNIAVSPKGEENNRESNSSCKEQERDLKRSKKNVRKFNTCCNNENSRSKSPRKSPSEKSTSSMQLSKHQGFNCFLCLKTFKKSSKSSPMKHTCKRDALIFNTTSPRNCRRCETGTDLNSPCIHNSKAKSLYSATDGKQEVSSCQAPRCRTSCTSIHIEHKPVVQETVPREPTVETLYTKTTCSKQRSSFCLAGALGTLDTKTTNTQQRSSCCHVELPICDVSSQTAFSELETEPVLETASDKYLHICDHLKCTAILEESNEEASALTEKQRPCFALQAEHPTRDVSSQPGLKFQEPVLETVCDNLDCCSGTGAIRAMTTSKEDTSSYAPRGMSSDECLLEYPTSDISSQTDNLPKCAYSLCNISEPKDLLRASVLPVADTTEVQDCMQVAVNDKLTQTICSEQECKIQEHNLQGQIEEKRACSEHPTADIAAQTFGEPSAVDVIEEVAASGSPQLENQANSSSSTEKALPTVEKEEYLFCNPSCDTQTILIKANEVQGCYFDPTVNNCYPSTNNECATSHSPIPTCDHVNCFSNSDEGRVTLSSQEVEKPQYGSASSVEYPTRDVSPPTSNAKDENCCSVVTSNRLDGTQNYTATNCLETLGKEPYYTFTTCEDTSSELSRKCNKDTLQITNLASKNPNSRTSRDLSFSCDSSKPSASVNNRTFQNVSLNKTKRNHSCRTRDCQLVPHGFHHWFDEKEEVRCKDAATNTETKVIVLHQHVAATVCTCCRCSRK